MSLNLKDVSTGVTYYANRYIRHFNHNPRGFYVEDEVIMTPPSSYTFYINKGVASFKNTQEESFLLRLESLTDSHLENFADTHSHT